MLQSVQAVSIAEYSVPFAVPFEALFRRGHHDPQPSQYFVFPLRAMKRASQYMPDVPRLRIIYMLTGACPCNEQVTAKAR